MNPSPHRRFHRSRGFVRARFSPEGYLGLHLTIGVLIMIFSAWCFSEIAQDVRPSTALVVFDQEAINAFHERAQPQITCSSIFFIGNGPFWKIRSSA